MSIVAIKKSVLFERIIPQQSVSAQQSIATSQKRLSLQDALNNNDMPRAQKAVKEYRESLENIMKMLEQHRSMTILTEQPQFDWGWGTGSYMSSCWQWENLMTHAVGYDIFMTTAMNLATKSNFKEASKNFHSAGSYVVSVLEDVLPNWTWKENPSIHMTFAKFWKSKLEFIYAMKDLCTLNYAYAGVGITDKNAIRLLLRVEGQCQKSLGHWINADNTALMNWARVSRALLLARQHTEKDEWGKALGLVNDWDPILKRLISDNHLNIIMETLVTQLNEIVDKQDDWAKTNNHVHFLEVESVPLEDVTELEEIKNKIQPL